MTSMNYSPKQIIELIRNASYDDFEIVTDREKNWKTISKYRLCSSFIIEIVKELEINNFDRSEKCNDKNYNVDYWYRFKINERLEAFDGIEDLVKLFIRIGIQNNKFKIIVRSFHDDDLYGIGD